MARIDVEGKTKNRRTGRERRTTTYLEEDPVSIDSEVDHAGEDPRGSVHGPDGHSGGFIHGTANVKKSINLPMRPLSKDVNRKQEKTS